MTNAQLNKYLARSDEEGVLFEEIDKKMVSSHNHLRSNVQNSKIHLLVTKMIY